MLYALQRVSPLARGRTDIGHLAPFHRVIRIFRIGNGGQFLIGGVSRREETVEESVLKINLSEQPQY
jgi:hypothetical protein